MLSNISGKSDIRKICDLHTIYNQGWKICN